MRKAVAPLAAAGALLWLPGQAALGKRPVAVDLQVGGTYLVTIRRVSQVELSRRIVARARAPCLRQHRPHGPRLEPFRRSQCVAS
jgi:hypothetical protein